MEKTEKTRGVLLIIWLSLTLLFNFLLGLAYLYLFLYPGVAEFLSSIPIWANPILGISAFLNVVFIIFLFMWKKWAFFAFCVFSGIAFTINLIIELETAAIFGLLGPVILYFMMKPKWKLFE